jgi:hypothetical protein
MARPGASSVGLHDDQGYRHILGRQTVHGDRVCGSWAVPRADAVVGSTKLWRRATVQSWAAQRPRKSSSAQNFLVPKPRGSIKMEFFSKGKEIATLLNRLSASQVQSSAVYDDLSLWPQPLDASAAPPPSRDLGIGWRGWGSGAGRRRSCEDAKR